MRKLLPVLLLLVLLASCATAPKYDTFVSIKGANSPQAQFAAEEISKSLSESGIGISDENSQWTIRFADIDSELGEQTYHIEVLGKIIEITGGDERGLMYGGLEVAEIIALYGIDTISEKTASPYVLHRGYMFNAPMDMRTPAYNSPGDSGQKNIANVWDIGFWHEFLDDMARNRFNILMMENINPYPSMVKVPGYEDIALEDVWRTTIPFDNTAKGDCTNIVQEKNWENYEILLKMTIDEKIAFWQEVMAYAKDRGIDFHLKHSNIYTFVESGKYGITDEKDNPVTQDYFYRSAKALLETYPDLKGLYLTPGENMGWSNDADAKISNIKWLHDVFGRAVNDVLESDPLREFHVSLNIGGSSVFNDIMSDINAEVLYTAQYAGTHMYATSTPHTADATLAARVEGTLFWLPFRNEDCFNMRWGNPDFMREFISGMPDSNVNYGFITGSDGYCYIRDYSSTDPDFQGQMYTRKHWFNYFLIGRLAFEPDLSDQRIKDVFKAHFPDCPEAENLLDATSEAGKIIPQVNKVYYQTNGDYTWFVEGNWSHPSTFGFIDLKRWMKNDNTYQDGTTMSVEEYAIRVASGIETAEDGRQLPTEAAQNLRSYAEAVLATVNELNSNPSKANTFSQKEFQKLATDDEAMAYLGLFYSERILGSIDIRIYNETQDESYRGSSVEHLLASAEYFDRYADIISSNYVPQQLSRVGYFNVTDIAKSVHDDVDIARTWKPKKLSSSYKAPSKDDYMTGE
ncbi:MAG: hypothetical protein II813_02730 [Spirochaetales bacterium]|nr:hypothetical protein [Spirochaetales bacterium]